METEKILNFNEKKYDFLIAIMDVMEFSDDPIIYAGLRDRLKDFLFSLATKKRQKDNLKILL